MKSMVANSSIQVRWGGGWRGGGWGHRGFGGYRGWGLAAGALAGAVIGGAIASSAYGDYGGPYYGGYYPAFVGYGPYYDYGPWQGAVREVVGIGRSVFSGDMKVSFQAARSIG
jgi:hypothetical protein